MEFHSTALTVPTISMVAQQSCWTKIRNKKKSC